MYICCDVRATKIAKDMFQDEVRETECATNKQQLLPQQSKLAQTQACWQGWTRPLRYLSESWRYEDVPNHNYEHRQSPSYRNVNLDNAQDAFQLEYYLVCFVLEAPQEVLWFQVIAYMSLYLSTTKTFSMLRLPKKCSMARVANTIFIT